jgi:hypothetical protein
MFLIPTFCEIVKNGPYNLKMVKIIPISFFCYQEWSIPSIFSTECLLVDPTILILVFTFCKIGKNGPYVIKNYGIFLPFFFKI